MPTQYSLGYMVPTCRLRSIGGLNDDLNRKLSQQVCKLLSDSLGISPDRVYLNFTDVEASNWGWNGSTFG